MSTKISQELNEFLKKIAENVIASENATQVDYFKSMQEARKHRLAQIYHEGSEKFQTALYNLTEGKLSTTTLENLRDSLETYNHMLELIYSEIFHM